MMNPKQQIMKAAPRAAFTLVELLVVMLVIVILSGITISVAKYAGWRARKAKADIEILKIRSALEEYRAVYGEYPIVGDPNHYPVDLEPDPATSLNLPPGFRRVDLVNINPGSTNVDWNSADMVNTNVSMRGVEHLPFTAAHGDIPSALDIDYRLTYPLTIRPKLEGRPPFMDFPMVTVCFLTWKNVLDAEQQGYIGTIIYYTDANRSVKRERYFLMGDPVNRVVAIDPLTGRQWGYYSGNGRTYILTNGVAYDSGRYVGSVDHTNAPQ